MSRKKKRKPWLTYLSETIPIWMGSPASVVVHTAAFIGIFFLYFLGFDFDQIMLILTTAVSLEAIYLSLFIQMSVNKASESLEDVEKDIDEIQEDVEDITEDIDEVQEDVTGLEGNLREIKEDIEEDINESKNDTPLQDPELRALIIRLEKQLTQLSTDVSQIKQEVQQKK